ncbi:MAG TPA: LuxR C-terminal-related transcriptional regulator [Candidatus Cybelea sp.]|nr:LuxR C-terminal-related transcriptional regulator [Candidatus Cybelea sp.]
MLIAPAGYGKSVALRQYLGSLVEHKVCFSLRSDHSTLLGFLRGFAEAFADHAPHAIEALAGAYERNTSSANRGADLARWMYSHLESFTGVVAVDDVHLAEGDPQVAQFLTSLIEQTKENTRWILASRSTLGLPVGTWLTYGDADLAINERDLAFSRGETYEAAERLGLTMRDEELADILRLTEGWPAAVSFALRTSMRSADLRNVSATTRELIYRLLAEQVYADLDEDERALLKVAITLPSIDLRVLERAGFDRAFTIIEQLRERTAFIYEESPRIYQCHELFREFLRHQSALAGKRSQELIHERAARALEESGNVEHAIVSYIAAEAAPEVVRLLERHGFDLLERARSDVVARAIEAVDEKRRRDNPTMLALQGALQATAGKFARAESLYRRALAGSENRDLMATTSLRLASLLANQGQDVTSALLIVGNDCEQTLAHRLEAFSLIAGQSAVAGEHQRAREAILQAKSLMTEVDSDAVRAKSLQHIGIAFHHLAMASEAVEVLLQSSELASELHLYSIASRANAVLSNLALHETDDVARQLHYAEAAAEAAVKGGDTFALRTALLQTLSARMRRGEVERSVDIEQRLSALKGDELTTRYIVLFRSMRLGWEGRFCEAQQLVATCWTELRFEVDRSFCGSHYALFLACDGQHEKSAKIAKEMLESLASITVAGTFRIRTMAISKALCALSEAINGRRAHADRILRGLRKTNDAVIALAMKAVDGLILRLRYGGDAGTRRIGEAIEGLSTLGYGDVARLLSAVKGNVRSTATEASRYWELTSAEVSVLRLLAEGLVPKEIAERGERSIYTVRAHIANAISKLGCHGRAEAIRRAQQMKLI